MGAVMRTRRGAVTVLVSRAAPTDLRHGTRGPDIEHTVDGVGINWAGGSEDTEHGQRIVSDVVLYCPPGADIRIGDRVLLPDGDRYRVTRKPEHWTSLYTGRAFGVRVHLEAVT